jgi:Protein of unknown function (DUF3306)
MTEPDNFLSRWSRRKLEAERDNDAPQRIDEAARPPEPHTADAGPVAVSPDKVPERRDNEDKNEQPFDLTQLPSIESITAETDIRAFLQKGVPAELSRAALRRAWIADPSIRDFIEIAENQWDFVTGLDLPGFGTLDVAPEEIRKMVAEVFGEVVKSPTEPDPTGQTASGSAANPKEIEPMVADGDLAELATPQVVASVIQDQTASTESPRDNPASIVRRDEDDDAMQQRKLEAGSEPLPTRHSHGRALPQ